MMSPGLFASLLLLNASAGFGQRFEIPTQAGKVTFEMTGVAVDPLISGTSIVTGTVTNNSRLPLRDVKLELVMTDQNGRQMDICNVVMNPDKSCTIWMSDPIQPGAAAPVNHRIFPGKRQAGVRINGIARAIRMGSYSSCTTRAQEVSSSPGINQRSWV